MAERPSSPPPPPPPAHSPPGRRSIFPDVPAPPPPHSPWRNTRSKSKRFTLDEVIKQGLNNPSPTTVMDRADDVATYAGASFMSSASSMRSLMRKSHSSSTLSRQVSDLHCHPHPPIEASPKPINTPKRAYSPQATDSPKRSYSPGRRNSPPGINPPGRSNSPPGIHAPEGSGGWSKIKKSYSTASMVAHIASGNSPGKSPILFRKFVSSIYVPEIARERVAVFNANCEVGASFVRSLSKGGSDVLAVVRVPSSRISRALYQLDGVSVTVADSLHDRKALIRTIKGVHRVYIITKYWEKFDGWEEQQAMTILAACHENNVPNVVFCTFEDTAKLQYTGERSQIRVDPRKPVRSDGTIRYLAKFEGMKNFDKIAKSLDIRVTHMITSFIDQANSQKSMCLIKGDGKLMAIPHFDVE